MNYLEEQRLKRGSDGLDLKRKEIDRYLNDENIGEKDRLELVHKRAKEIEQKAEMEERVIRNHRKGGGEGLESEFAVNDMYIDAITAKLKVLDKI